MTMAAFMPPNPKELETAASTGGPALRQELEVDLRIGELRLQVPGSVRVRGRVP